MGTRARAAVFVLSVLTVVVVGALGVAAIRAPDPPRWPNKVAVIGLDDSDGRQPVRFLALADPLTRTVVVVPPEAVVEIPGSGFLRAYHAWRLGGAPLVRGTLERLFGVEVPFSVTGGGSDFPNLARSFTTAEIVARYLDDLRAALEEGAGSWEILEVRGERKQGPQGPFLVLDPASVSEAARAIGGLGTRVFVDPSGDDALVRPTPTSEAGSEEPAAPTPPPDEERIDPAGIRVEVLNGGRVDMAASRTAERLRELGYEVVRVADFTSQDRERSIVYFRSDDAESHDKAVQVAAELGYAVEEIPDGLRMRDNADVLLILGHDAQV